MPKQTATYGFKKPLYSENADIAVINESLDEIDNLLTPSVSAATAPNQSDNGGKLSVVLGWLANRIKAITGMGSWQTTPSVTLEDCHEHILHGVHDNATVASNGFMSFADKQVLEEATAANVSETLIKRDANGRAKVTRPAEEEDIANKAYVDTNFVNKSVDATMNAKLVAHSNTDYMKKQVRNVVFWNSGTTPPATGNGDIIIKTF